MDDIQTPGAVGIHEDKNGQPFALVSASFNIDEWSLTASHETLEMLVDPFGNHLVAGDSPKPNQSRVSFLVEVSDPSEAADFAYSVNGVLVSDFYSPNFFDPVKAPGVRYSYTDTLHAVSSTGKVKSSVSCWHSLATYLSLIDPGLQPDADCQLTAAVRTAPFVGKAVTTTTATRSVTARPVTVNLTINVGEGS